MSEPATTRFPRVLRREEHAHSPSQARYVGIAIFLAVITAIEVAIYYVDIAKVVLITCLVFLASVKFATVAAFFMHLRFDGRLLTYIFVVGLFLAFFVFFIAITSLKHIH